MRNGNKYSSYEQLKANDGSYPTYEEWKHHKEEIDSGLKKRSYPTYEEWKLR